MTVGEKYIFVSDIYEIKLPSGLQYVIYEQEDLYILKETMFSYSSKKNLRKKIKMNRKNKIKYFGINHWIGTNKIIINVY